MEIRLLFATPDAGTQALLDSLLYSAQPLTCPAIVPAKAHTQREMLARVDAGDDDVILLDWALAESDTPALVGEILARNPKMRIVALLPLDMRQYRQQVWDAGACNSIPKEHMDQEWLASILCVMYRAMQREARLVALLQQHVVVA